MILAFFFFKRALQVVVDILELSGIHVVVKGNVVQVVQVVQVVLVVQVVPRAPCNIALDFPVQALVDILQPSTTCVVATYQSRRDLRTTYEHVGICFSLAREFCSHCNYRNAGILSRKRKANKILFCRL